MQKKQLIGLMMLSAMFLVISATIYGSFATAAVDQEIAGSEFNGSQAAGTPVTYRFRQRTQLRLNSSNALTLAIDCDADNIGDQTVEINLDTDAVSTLTMNCTETQAELGLLKGETVQTRTQTRNQAGFCANLSLQGGNLIKAQLKIQIKAENQNKAHVWAYYDNAKAEWVEVPTTVVDGYAVAETTHFSVWTVLTSDATIDGFLLLIPVSAAAIIALAVLQKRRHK